MEKHKIFISCVPSEFNEEKKIIQDYLRNDPLLRRFFELFVFKNTPDTDQRHGDYLDEVEKCAIFVAIFGREYGPEDRSGTSSLQREFDLASKLKKYRLIFIQGTDDAPRHVKTQALIHMSWDQVIRRRFSQSAELISSLYAALVNYLDENELIRLRPFDAAYCHNSSLADLDEEKITRFLHHACIARRFPLPENTKPTEVLVHLNLLDKGRPTNAAILLFGKQPQRFLPSSEVRCAHFHGTKVTDPIPSFQVFKGTVFNLVEQAVDFILSKINRHHSSQAPEGYEIPPEVVREAIVNAIAHRDYIDNNSVQVTLFSDRLEIQNPGYLPPSLSLEKLSRLHASIPANPLLSGPLYLANYFEQKGTGNMIEQCRSAGLPEPEFSLSDDFIIIIRRKPAIATEASKEHAADHGAEQDARHAANHSTQQDAGHVIIDLHRLVLALPGELPRAKIQENLKLKGRSNFEERYLKPALKMGFIEMTLPHKPKSRFQKYRLTQKGLDYLKSQESRQPSPTTDNGKPD